MVYYSKHKPLCLGLCADVYSLIFCRKASLALIRKMVHYAQPGLLAELTETDLLSINFASQLVEVIAIVLDNEVCMRLVPSDITILIINTKIAMLSFHIT